MRKEMVHFAGKLLLFALMIATFDAGFARVLDLGRPDDYRAFIESKRDFDELEEIDILLLGDSHIADAIHPGVLRELTGLKAFNFGVYHQSPLELHYLLRDLLGRLRAPPRLVILGTSPRMFSRKASAGKYTPLFIKKPLILAELLTASESKHLALFTAAGKKIELFEPMCERILRGRRQPVTRVIREIDAGHICNVRHYRDEQDLIPRAEHYSLEINDRQLEYFARSIQLLQRAGIEVLVVNPPLYQRYYERIRQTKTYLDFSAAITVIASEHDIGVVNPDNEMLDGTLRAEDFLDGEHLCRTGAEKFTAALSRRLSQEKVALPLESEKRWR